MNQIEPSLNDYIHISKKLTREDSMKHIKVALLSNFTVNGLGESLKVFCFEQGLYVDYYMVPYNQYHQEILNTSSGLYSFEPDIIYLILDVENLLGDFYFFPYRFNSQQRKDFISDKFNDLKNLINILKRRVKAKIVINNLLIPFYSSRGIIENKQEGGIKSCVQSFNIMLESLAMNDPPLFIFDVNSFYSRYGHEVLCDKKISYLADMKISPLGLVKLSLEYMAYIFPLASMSKKCIVLDLDNTLWGGVIGEEGIDKIKLGPEKEGRPFLDFQKRLLELSERGVLLAINSKNNYEDVINVLRNHKHMVLREDNFVCMKINWQDKFNNMREISKEINIGLDSLVFIDDDPSNRELIRNFSSEVLVVDLPEDPSLYSEVIENLKAFNLFSITEDDLNRQKMYGNQVKREKLRMKVKDIESFIKQIEIKVDILKANEAAVPRIAQLTQKTNQFNLTTKRYQEEDIKNFLESTDYTVKFINVRDKFGDYGSTGVVIIKKINGESCWFIDSFLLSCRVLGKNVEFSLMQNIIDDARKEGTKKLEAVFITTKKNEPAKNFLMDCGFHLTEEKQGVFHYSLNLGKKKINSKFIS